jgi:hypothetical protein
LGAFRLNSLGLEGEAAIRKIGSVAAYEYRMGFKKVRRNVSIKRQIAPALSIRGLREQVKFHINS